MKPDIMVLSEYDYVVVGGGPAAIAALQAFGSQQSLAVISGKSASDVPRAEVHPKIQAVSVDNREKPGVCAAYVRSESPGKPLFSSAIAGGLANYWGQQFVRYNEYDEWPRSVFKRFDAYERECALIERAFIRSGGDDILRINGADGAYKISVPQLLTGCVSHPKSGLMAMRHAIHDEIERTSAHLFDDRAQLIGRKQGGWEILLESGQSIRARRVILAAGVIGTSQLVSNSFEDVSEIEFSDHSPWMLYTTGLRKIYSQRPMASRSHFNALTLEKVTATATQMFASLYDMRQANINLLLASTLGRTSNVLRGIRAPIGAQLLKPVQVWTPMSFDTVVVNVRDRVSRCASTNSRVPAKDATLARAVSVLSELGARCLKATPTSPGYGFHYHNLRIRTASGETRPVDEFLEGRFGDSIKCVDASVLSTIGLRPHTLTAMATAKAITRSVVQ